MKHYLFSYSKTRQYILFVGDVLVLLLAILVSYALRRYINIQNPSLNALLSKFSPMLTLVVLPHLLSLYLLDLYNLNRLIYRFRSSVMLVVSVAFAGLIISAIFFFVPRYVFGRQVLLIHLFVSSFFLVSWRFLFNELLYAGEKIKRLALLGEKSKLTSFSQELNRMTNSGVQVSAVYFTSESGDVSPLPDSVTRYTSVDDLLQSKKFDILLFDSLDTSLSQEDVRKLMQVKYEGRAVFDLPSFYKNLTGKIPLNYIDGRWLLSLEGLQGQVSKPYVHVKRLLDVIVSMCLMLAFFPFFLLIALLIKLDSRGGVIFSQERLGIHRRPFQCLKFRTMVENAEAVSGPVWSSEDDPRITRVGKILRKTRLDELPQLWNIFKGDISFVGPRPIREHFALQLSEQIPFYGVRFSVQPGLSGWAQVNYDYAGSEEGQLEKFQYELFYIQNMSLFLDLLTIFKTINTVFKGEGK